MSNAIKKFCNDNIGILEDLLDSMEDEIEDLYLTDKEWDEVYIHVVDPINRAINHLEEMRDSVQEIEEDSQDDLDDQI